MLAQLEDLAAGGNKKVADKAEDVAAKLTQALAKLEAGDAAGALGELEGAVGDLEAMVKDGLLDASEGEQLMDDLAAAGKLLAEEAIAAAEQRGGDAKKIAAAKTALAKGDDLRGRGASRTRWPSTRTPTARPRAPEREHEGGKSPRPGPTRSSRAL